MGVGGPCPTQHSSPDPSSRTPGAQHPQGKGGQPLGGLWTLLGCRGGSGVPTSPPSAHPQYGPCTQRRDCRLPRPHPCSKPLSQRRGTARLDGRPKRRKLEIHRFPSFFPFNIVLTRRPSYICLTSMARRRGQGWECRAPEGKLSASVIQRKESGAGPRAYVPQNLLARLEGLGTRGQVCPLDWTWVS